MTWVTHRTASRHVVPIGVVLAATMSWRVGLAVSGYRVSPAPRFSLGALIDLATGDGPAYRREVVANFFTALMREPLLTVMGHGLSQSWCLLLWLALLVAVVRIVPPGGVTPQVGNGPRRLWPLDRLLPVVVIALGAVAYLGGLLLLYLFRFSEYEAVRLASYARYVNTYWTGVAMLATAGTIWQLVQPVAGTGRADHTELVRLRRPIVVLCAGWLAGLLAIVHVLAFGYFITHPTIRSTALRQRFMPILAKADQAGVRHGAKVSVISQYTTGLDYTILSYGLADCYVMGPWSIGEPKNAGDVWTKPLTVDEWATTLSKIDYVLLDSIDDGFVQTYGGLFATGSDPRSGTVYEVVRDGGLVRLVKLA